MDSIISELEEYLERNTFELILDHYNTSLKDNLSPSAVVYCIKNFVDAEMDCWADGTRGLGRMTEYFPRLGGYFRKGMQRFSAEETKNLYEKLFFLILRSYLITMLLIKNKEGATGISNEDATLLYKKWIPKIYSFSLDTLNAGTEELIMDITANSVNDIFNFIKKNDLHKNPLNDEKSLLIVQGYMIAGIALAFVKQSRN